MIHKPGQMGVNGSNFAGKVTDTCIKRLGLIDQFCGKLNGQAGMPDMAIEFAIDEIGQPSKADADGCNHGTGVDEVEETAFMAAGEDSSGHKDADDATMGGHSTILHHQQAPIGEVVGKGGKHAGAIEGGFSESAPDDHAENSDEQDKIRQFSGR